MDQQDAWEREYTAQQLLSPSTVPHAEVMRFVRWLKKERRKAGERLDLEGMRVLDLGSGTGRNSAYFAREGARVTGFEFAPTALALAKAHAQEEGLSIDYCLQDIGAPYPLPDASVDIALDVTSSNSLSDRQRQVCLRELQRVLAPGGHLFVRALSSEGDPNARELVKRFPGPDPDTYVHPDLGLIEKVFSRASFTAAYAPYLAIRSLERVEHYATVAGRRYRRSYWVAYLQKAAD